MKAQIQTVLRSIIEGGSGLMFCGIENDLALWQGMTHAAVSCPTCGGAHCFFTISEALSRHGFRWAVQCLACAANVGLIPR